MAGKDSLEKIKKLRAHYTLAEDQRTLSDLEKKIHSEIKKKNFAKNPLIKDIVRDSITKIKEINFLLSYDDELNKPESATLRMSLFRERDVHKFYIKRFGVVLNDNNLDAIDSELDELLDRI